MQGAPSPQSAVQTRAHVFPFFPLQLFERPESGHSVTGIKIVPMPGPVRYQNKGALSGTGMLRYRNEIPYSM